MQLRLSSRISADHKIAKYIYLSINFTAGALKISKSESVTICKIEFTANSANKQYNCTILMNDYRTNFPQTIRNYFRTLQHSQSITVGTI